MSQICDFFSWYKSQSEEYVNRPWLIIGKGPTFSKIRSHDISQFNKFGLNHVVNEVKVNILHCIDLDVIDKCSEKISENTEYLLMPWVPHVNNKPGKYNLAELIARNSILKSFYNDSRLLFYNKVGSSKSVEIRPGSPQVKVVYFSAEAPYALLGMAGVKSIRTIGIDGGSSYSQKFSKLGTLLLNGWSSFDRQFDEIAKNIMKYGIESSPIDIDSPIRIYVAATDKQLLSVKVLEYSIRLHSSVSTEIHNLCDAKIDIPIPDSKSNRAKTPFSFQRFLIPELSEYSGRAIYLDSDMLVFSDIKELWCIDMMGNGLISAKANNPDDRSPQYSVSLIDCEKTQWKISEIIHGLNEKKYTYKELMHRMIIVKEQSDEIPSCWNSLEDYDENVTKLLHYTDMSIQPWLSTRNKYAYLWCKYLFQAIEENYIPSSMLVDHIRNGWVRPSLLYQLDHNIIDPLLLPREIIEQDLKSFIPPHIHGNLASNRKYGDIATRYYAYARNIYYRSGIKGVIKKLRKK